MKIKMTIGETEVEGNIIYLSAGDMTVITIKPYQNISMGLHIPYFSRPYSSFDGEYEKDAESLLNRIYDIGCHLDLEMIKIKEKLNHVKESVGKLPQESEYDEYDPKFEEIMNAFFKECFPMCVPHGTRADVIDIIEGKKGLR